ncbi:MAG: glucose-6-phosphate dehydrogenase assembly protein OpcA [Candidatus Nanopelagicales bacterium]
MTTRLEKTSAGEIVRTINAERHRIGATATGMVLTMIIVTDEENQSDATRAAAYSAMEHPCRVITVIPRPGRVDPQLDANIDVGDTMGPGETVRLRLRGDLANHAASVALPLLLPDTPVVVWWPTDCPTVPSEDPIGAMAQRRITDAASNRHPMHELLERQKSYVAGDTDLAWTRTTVWRSLLAAALDQPFASITSVDVSCERSNPSGALLEAWLHSCLQVPVNSHRSRGPGITDVVIHTHEGPIELSRPNGRTGRLTRPGITPHDVPLPRRDLRDLIGEELRRLDPDETYADALAAVRLPTPASRRRTRRAKATAGPES